MDTRIALIAKHYELNESEQRAVLQLMEYAFSAGISVGLTPAPDRDLFNAWLSEEVSEI